MADVMPYMKIGYGWWTDKNELMMGTEQKNQELSFLMDNNYLGSYNILWYIYDSKHYVSSNSLP